MNKEQLYKFLININYPEKKEKDIEEEIIIRGELCDYEEPLKDLIKDIFKIVDKKCPKIICDYEKEPYKAGQVIVMASRDVLLVINIDSGGCASGIDTEGLIEDLPERSNEDYDIRIATKEEIAAFVDIYKGEGFISL